MVEAVVLCGYFSMYVLVFHSTPTTLVSGRSSRRPSFSANDCIAVLFDADGLRNKVIYMDVLLNMFCHRIVEPIQVFVEGCIHYKWRTCSAKQYSFEAINVEGTLGIIWIAQPEEACGIPVSLILTDMQESLLNISREAILVTEQSDQNGS